MSRTKYKVGFVLIETNCLNCGFSYEGEGVGNFFDLKEDVFELAEHKHTADQNIYCGEDRQLEVRFINAAREIVEK